MGGSCTSVKPKLSQQKKIAVKCSAENLESQLQIDIQQQQKPERHEESIIVKEEPLLKASFEQLELRKSILQNLRKRGISCQISNKRTNAMTTATQLSQQQSYSYQPSTQLAIPQNPSYLEIFINERKKYMQDKGILSYSPYTILPAPKLKSLKANLLFQRRISSLAHIPCISSSTIDRTPTDYLKKQHLQLNKGVHSSGYQDHSKQHREAHLVIQPHGDQEINTFEVELDL